MNGTSILVILAVLVVVALVVVLIRRAKRKSATDETASTSVPTSTPLRSAIVSPGGEHSSATVAPVSGPTSAAPAQTEVEAEPEPEETEPTAAELIAQGDEHKHAFDYDDAIESYEGAVDAVTAEHGRDSLEFADLLVKTEDAYLARDNQDDTDDLNCDSYLRALSIMERCVGVFDVRLLPVLNRITSFNLLVGKVSEAEGLVRRQQLIELRAKGPVIQEKAPAPVVHAVVQPIALPVVSAVAPSASSPLASRIDSDPATQTEPAPVAASASASIVVDAHQSLRAALDSGNADVDKSAAAGDTARAEYDYDTAADHYGEALESAQTSFGRDAVQLVPILVRLGETCHVRDILESDEDGDTYTDPINHMRLALSLLVKEGGVKDVRLIPVLTNMVAFSDQTGDHFKADRYIAMIDSINDANRHGAAR